MQIAIDGITRTISYDPTQFDRAGNRLPTPEELQKIADSKAKNDVNLGADHDTAAYIAMMHPPVALALADWLDDEAARGLGRPDNVAAYAVARAVLREAGE